MPPIHSSGRCFNGKSSSPSFCCFFLYPYRWRQWRWLSPMPSIHSPGRCFNGKSSSPSFFCFFQYPQRWRQWRWPSSSMLRIHASLIPIGFFGSSGFTAPPKSCVCMGYFWAFNNNVILILCQSYNKIANWFYFLFFLWVSWSNFFFFHLPWFSFFYFSWSNLVWTDVEEVGARSLTPGGNA